MCPARLREELVAEHAAKLCWRAERGASVSDAHLTRLHGDTAQLVRTELESEGEGEVQQEHFSQVNVAPAHAARVNRTAFGMCARDA